MKNIHVLPTDKPSRLFYLASNLHLEQGQLISPKNYQHIYITSDKEIKEGDWFIRKNKIHQLRWDDGNGNLYTKNGLKIYKSSSKKIILTTDPRLAPDVQKIDDEFLEWFVKNPSCEEVEVVLEIGSLRWSDSKNNYKIIIPKEEPKQVGIDWKKFPKSTREKVGYVEPKQETLEEFIERASDECNIIHFSKYEFEKFIKLGAKWQQERMYSKEEVYEILLNYQSNYPYASNEIGLKKWFEQFKKK